MKDWKTEAETAIIIGYTRQTLRNWRKGYKVGSYAYSPILVEGEDWVKVGMSVMFTDEFFKKLREVKKNDSKR